MDLSEKTENYFEDGVEINTSVRAIFGEFEKQYLRVREKEGHVLTIEQIRQLPFVDKDSPDSSHWRIRRKNITRFLKYLKSKKPSTILDIGCGNGFFSNMMQESGHRVTAVDVNLYELKQAARAFPKSGIRWLYADIFQPDLQIEKTDIITFCCSFQYFKDPITLIDRLMKLLRTSGEIHIIDTPFYDPASLTNAKNNSKEYYKKMDTPAMTDHYHHHSMEIFSKYQFDLLYKPGWKTKVLKDSPFPWIRISKK